MGFLYHLSPNCLWFICSTFRPLLEQLYSLGIWFPSSVPLYPLSHPRSMMGPEQHLPASPPLLDSTPASILPCTSVW